MKTVKWFALATAAFMFAACENTPEEGVTSIGVKAFENNTYVEEIILPESLNEIKERAFRGCQNLTTINIPKNISNLHESYFDEESKIYVKVSPN